MQHMNTNFLTSDNIWHAQNWLCYAKNFLLCLQSYGFRRFRGLPKTDFMTGKTHIFCWKLFAQASNNFTFSSQKQGCVCWISNVSQIETEKIYWLSLLELITAVIILLVERDLAFRGNDEIIGSLHNENYLGLLELIAKYDFFLTKHIHLHANKGKRHTSYLSKTTCEYYFIASSIRDQIICEIKSKYCSVSLNSTPDISHVDQLTLIMRYMSCHLDELKGL